MEKTIAAVSTGLAPSGILIIRMSGDESVQIADRVFRGKKPLSEAKSHTIRHGFVFDAKSGEDLDEVLVSVMRAPHTYTGEDTVEINCHGGLLVAKKVLELLIKNGAEPAEPGEFTKRAFLNGRMDLSRAEAVIDVIEAQNDFAAKASVLQLKGSVSEKIRSLRKELLLRIAYIEAALDDPEHYDLDGYAYQLKETVLSVRDEIRALIKTADYGSILKAGIRTVIAGRPNAGKSSLLNALSGHEKAIVTEIAGTTRDVLEVPVQLKDVSLILMDTAGLRKTEDTVEKIGVGRAKEALDNADLVLYLIDAASGKNGEDEENLSSLHERGKKVLVLENKTDLVAERRENECREPDVLRISAKTGSGLDTLSDRICSLFREGAVTQNDEVVITSARHKALLSDAEKSLSLVLEGIEGGVSEDLINIDLTDAYASLGKIIGEEVGEDVINEVFAKFCMGK
ncbi:MAG: tRNA uridine-5-carboxymethylaminomethyl(34) synthesis GTPase MnmE [Lachnospiraceae bacterium]|nr:tRNA uridine-5-carboxymethylaminomethyl(34) synthesis GTPase MnmE [Lachnospiraceae bacterium]